MKTIRSLTSGGTFVLWLLLTAPVLAANSGPASSPGPDSFVRIGRPVRVVSLSFRDKTRDEMARLVDREAGVGADLVILPETWLGQKDNPETLEGPTITAFSALAKKHSTYIVCPIDRREGKRRLNSAVLLDRAGKVAGIYDKVFPYWSEFELKQPVSVGENAPVFQTDFGNGRPLVTLTAMGAMKPSS